MMLVMTFSGYKDRLLLDTRGQLQCCFLAGSSEGKHFGADGGSCTAPAEAAGLRLQQIKAQIVIESDGKRI